MLPKDYASAFEAADEPFLFYYWFDRGGRFQRTEITRGAFLSLARRAARMLLQNGCAGGGRVLHCFGANEYHDLAFRFGAWMIGAVPVTVNWQADTFESVLYKLHSTDSRVVVYSSSFDSAILDGLKANCTGVSFLDAGELSEAFEIQSLEGEMGSESHITQMTIFTSGTTGAPKGVMLTRGNYDTNRRTFEQMLCIRELDRFAVLVVNPLHHANSTAICDWALRRPNSHIHLIERYSTAYWEILSCVAAAGYHRIVAPAVSRHFDFLDELVAADRLPVSVNRLRDAMGKIDFLIGSAPVGPKTIDCLKMYAGRTPAVRFGATETCLQVLGIPHTMAEEDRIDAFKKGRHYLVDGNPCPGYYIGRPHPPYTEVRIVRSIDRESKDFLKNAPSGIPGYLITRGSNLMKGYVGDPAATREVFEGDWYLGLKDICFALKNDGDGELDYYWMSRDAAILIRGGANYACEQIGTELQEFIAGRYDLPKESFDVAVVGIRVGSEHEDACCVTIELKDEKAVAKKHMIEETFLEAARRHVSKGARPDCLRFARIPRNFKGAVLAPALKKSYASFLEGEGVMRVPKVR